VNEIQSKTNSCFVVWWALQRRVYIWRSRGTQNHNESNWKRCVYSIEVLSVFIATRKRLAGRCEDTIVLLQLSYMTLLCN